MTMTFALEATKRASISKLTEPMSGPFITMILPYKPTVDHGRNSIWKKSEENYMIGE